MKELHPDALPLVIESANETMYRRIEGLRRGPPILMALADGEIWTTPELVRYHLGAERDRQLATYQVLTGYARKGLVEQMPFRRCQTRKAFPPRLPLFGRVTVCELAQLLDLAPSTIWRMRKAGRLPPATAAVTGHWSYWDVRDLREFFKGTGGFVRLYAFHVSVWRITPEGLERAQGKRR